MPYNYNSFDSFNSITWENFQNNLYQAIDNEIENRGDDYILNIPENDYITYLIKRYTIKPLLVDKESEEVETPKEFREDLSQYNDSYAIARYGRYRCGYSIRISYSYSGDGQLFKVQPNPYSLTGAKISVDESMSKVSFVIEIFSQNPSEFQREKESTYNRAFANLDYLNSCLKSYNSSLPQIVKQKFLTVKKKRLEKTNFFAAIKVKKTPDVPKTYGVPVISKKKEVTRPQAPQLPTNKVFTPEPTLDLSTYNDILSLLSQVGTSMERKPSLYLNKDEEALRDVFVMNLETHFDGTTATGETFNHNGKTDILLKYAADNSNLFIAECKFWHGAKHFMNAISQLLGYLTWRDSKTALIVFVNGTNFTTVLNSINETIVSHPYYVRLNKQRNSSSANYIFRLPQDEKKEIYIEVMAFNFDKSI